MFPTPKIIRTAPIYSRLCSKMCAGLMQDFCLSTFLVNTGHTIPLPTVKLDYVSIPLCPWTYDTKGMTGTVE